MGDPSGQQLNRRLSEAAACSPTATHACQGPLRAGEGSPSVARKSRHQDVRTGHESQEIENCQFDSTSGASSPSHDPTSAPTVEQLHQPTDQDIMYEIWDLIMQNMDPDGVDISHYYATAMRIPPITPESLAELDMPRIINNPKLRHDVNFDRELHFRPNVDGSKGKQKLRSAENYWQALEGEFFVYGYASMQKSYAGDAAEELHWQRVLKHSQHRLRYVFEAIRDILSTLVPDQEQKRVAARLDVELIMQEITNGVCDLIDLSNWIAKVVKKHCAPMRDELVDAMQEDIRDGARQDKPEKLVSGLRQLLNILEAMKLDVANHQIRHMRPLLVDDSVNFERRYNAHRLSVGKIDVARCQRWFNEELQHLSSRATEMAQPSPTHLDALISALLSDILFNESHPCPPTFYLDNERLRLVRSDLRNSISHELCRDVLAELSPPDVSPPNLLKAQGALQCTISAIVGTSGRFTERADNIAVEIVRLMLLLEGRYPPFDGTYLGMVEQKLSQSLQPESQPFNKLARDTFDRLLPRLKVSVAEHIRLSAIDLQDALIPPASNNLPPPPMGFGAVCAPPVQAAQYDPDEDIIRRLTHVICLHWQVWADLVYLAPPQEAPSPPSALTPREPPSASVSPMIPIAQAVYAPGKKFLPVGVTVTEVPSSMPTPAATPQPTPEPVPKPTRKDTDPGEPASEQEPLDAHQQHYA